MDPHTRDQNLKILTELGYDVAPSLPIKRGGQGVRDPRDIAARLCALDLVFTWVVYDSERISDQQLRDYATRSDLEGALTPSEMTLWRLPRDDAHAHRSSIGWRLENEWPLAWALGFDPAPQVSGDMISNDITSSIVETVLPKLSSGLDEMMERVQSRSDDELRALEDLFYCAHNSARSAQLGGATVPDGFDPISGGGVIHERRHALTWCVFPGVHWDDVDLST